MMVNLLSLVIFFMRGVGYATIYFREPLEWGVINLLALIIAVGNIVVCSVYLKQRRLIIHTLGVKYSRLGVVFGILGAVTTIITEGIFNPIVAIGKGWTEGNLALALFVLPFVLWVLWIVALVLFIAQLGYYLTSIVMLILLYDKIIKDGQDTKQMLKSTFPSNGEK
jgi:hypothetical protein